MFNTHFLLTFGFVSKLLCHDVGSRLSSPILIAYEADLGRQAERL